VRQIGAIGKPLPDQALAAQRLQHAQQGGLGQAKRHVHFVQAGRAARLHLQQDIQSALKRADGLDLPFLHPVPVSPYGFNANARMAQPVAKSNRASFKAGDTTREPTMDGKMDNKPSVLLVITQDTKEEEARFARAALEAGVRVVHLDPSVRRTWAVPRSAPKTWPPPP
jgi:hypothetical protein